MTARAKWVRKWLIDRLEKEIVGELYSAAQNQNRLVGFESANLIHIVVAHGDILRRIAKVSLEEVCILATSLNPLDDLLFCWQSWANAEGLLV